MRFSHKDIADGFCQFMGCEDAAQKRRRLQQEDYIQTVLKEALQEARRQCIPRPADHDHCHIINTEDSLIQSSHCLSGR